LPVIWKQLRAVCDKYDLLLMLDEIQTGNGRTGKYFAYQHTAINARCADHGQGLGNGFPIGACLVSGKANGPVPPGQPRLHLWRYAAGLPRRLDRVQELQKGPDRQCRRHGRTDHDRLPENWPTCRCRSTARA
jgi:acetylornithine/N-succinyldiaminopimelate aminotransferase